MIIVEKEKFIIAFLRQFNADIRLIFLKVMPLIVY
jgi:hypothetical protein